VSSTAPEHDDVAALIVEAQHALRVIVPDLAPRVTVRAFTAPDGSRSVGVDTHRLDPEAAATVQRIVSYVKQCQGGRPQRLGAGGPAAVRQG
jgi:hypothetical protein